MLPILLIGSDKNQIRLYIQKLLTEHKIDSSHVYTYEPENSILIDDIRDITTYVAKRDMTHKHLVVIHKFDTAKSESQNAFLKTLEENGDLIQFLLIAQEETSLLPTIRSRTLIHYMKESAVGMDILDTYGFRQKPMTYAIWLSCSAKVPKDKAMLVLDAVLEYVRDLYLKSINPNFQSKASDVMHKILQIRSNARHIAINPEFALDAVGYEVVKLVNE